MDSHVLHPGEYFIELEFDRPVDPAVLHRALTAMGFGVIVFDQSLPAVNIGAGALARVATKAPLPVAKSAVSSVASASRYAAVAATAIPVAPSSKPSPPPPIQSRYTLPASAMATAIKASPAAYVADGGMPAALKPSGSAAASKPAGAVAAALAASPSLAAITASPTDAGIARPGVADSSKAAAGDPAPAGPEPKGQFVASPGGGGGGAASSPAPEEEPEQTPTPPPAPEFPGDVPPNPSAPAPMPAAVSELRASSASSMAAQLAASPAGSTLAAHALTALWTKWKEWGSPFASGPMVATSGASTGDDDPLRFRALVRLDRAIVLDDRPGMRWLFVKTLSIPFLSDLVFQSNPHPLRQGSLYEMRFLSRAKSNPTRESVKATLTEMGFQPVKLAAIKRNMSLPNRPASLTLWYGMAVWRHVDSVIVNDDQFFFETVREIRAQ